MPTTTRLALPYPAPADTADVPRDMSALATKLDPNTSIFLQGTAAARPAAGTAGRLHYATDTGALSYDTGTAWVAVAPYVPTVAYASYTWAGAQTLSQNAWTLLPSTGWTTNEEFNGHFANAGFMADVAGLYWCEITAGYAANATGARGAGGAKNNVLTSAIAQILAAISTANSGSAQANGLVRLGVGDWVRPMAYVNGAAPNCTGAWIQIFRVGD